MQSEKKRSKKASIDLGKCLVLENKCFYNRAGHFMHRNLFLLQLLLKHGKESKAQLQPVWSELEG